MLAFIKKKFNKHKTLFIFHFAAVLTVLVLMAWELAEVRFYQALYCLLTLLIFQIPFISEKLLKIHVPSGLRYIIILFTLAANVCGEIFNFYSRLPVWDSALHIIWGFCGGAIGYGLLVIFNKHLEHELSPSASSRSFAALFCLCFSVTTGVLWEFTEFFMDSVFKLDMQKDTYVKAVSSVLLNPQGENSAVKVWIESVAVNGIQWKGYIDIGLIDTMKDLVVNFCGGMLFALCAGFCSRRKRLWHIINKLIPVYTGDKKPVDLL